MSGESLEELLASGAVVPDRPGSKRLVPAAQSAVVPVDVVAACRGEQEHFEAWAKLYRYDMSQHPLHYIFTDPKTDAARMGWKAALAYAHDAAEPLAAAPAPSSLAGGEVRALDRHELAAIALDTGIAIGVSTWPDEQMSDALTVTDAILAALSPEAPAREGDDVPRDEKGRTAFEIIADCNRESMMRRAGVKDQSREPLLGPPADMAVSRILLAERPEIDREAADLLAIKINDALAALTPRHEAPARDGVALDKRIADAAERDRRERDKAFRGESYEPLTPRHEAPASEDEARRKLIECIEQWDGETEYDADDLSSLADSILHAFNGPPVVRPAAAAELSSNPCQLEAPAEGAGEVPQAAINSLCRSVENFDNGYEWGCDPVAVRALLKYLRARSSAPEAREVEAVAGAKALAFFKWARDFFWCEDGCEIDGGDFQDAAERFGLIVKVPFDPERHADNGYGLESGDEWYETEPAVELALTRPAAPSADKLRIAVEALEPFSAAFRGLSSRWEGHETHWHGATSPIAVDDLRRADQALDALQAEGA